MFQGGSVIRLFHKELEAYMVGEGLFDEEVTEDGKKFGEKSAAKSCFSLELWIRLRLVIE